MPGKSDLNGERESAGQKLEKGRRLRWICQEVVEYVILRRPVGRTDPKSRWVHPRNPPKGNRRVECRKMEGRRWIALGNLASGLGGPIVDLRRNAAVGWAWDRE